MHNSEGALDPFLNKFFHHKKEFVGLINLLFYDHKITYHFGRPLFLQVTLNARPLEDLERYPLENSRFKIFVIIGM